MAKISACMIVLNEEAWIRQCLESIEEVVDEIIIVDGGSTDRTIGIIGEFVERNNNIKLFHKPWKDDWGAQRQYALKQATGDWILQIDGDEILDDRGYKLKELAEHGKHDCYDIEYIHFIRDFGHIDATEDKHIGINRFFRNTGDVRYKTRMHELAHSGQWKSKGFADIIIWHLGYLKGLHTIILKYRKNLKYSEAHTKPFLRAWREAHLSGRDVKGVLKIKEFKDWDKLPWSLTKILK